MAANPRGREWGIARDIRLTDAAQTSPMLAGKPAVFDAFIMHLDVVTRLPEGIPVLATNTHSPIQAAVIEEGASAFWSTQYHPEYNLYEMARLIAARAKALVREGYFPDEAAVATYAARMKELSANPEFGGAANGARRGRRHHRPADPGARAAQLAAVHRRTEQRVGLTRRLATSRAGCAWRATDMARNRALTPSIGRA